MGMKRTAEEETYLGENHTKKGTDNGDDDGAIVFRWRERKKASIKWTSVKNKTINKGTIEMHRSAKSSCAWSKTDGKKWLDGYFFPLTRKQPTLFFVFY